MNWKYFGLYAQNVTRLNYSEPYNDIKTKSECWCGDTFGTQGPASQSCSLIRRQEKGGLFTLRMPRFTLKVYAQPAMHYLKAAVLSIAPGATKITSGTCESHGCKPYKDPVKCEAAALAIGYLNKFEAMGDLAVNTRDASTLDQYSGMPEGCQLKPANGYPCCRDNRECCKSTAATSSTNCMGDDWKSTMHAASWFRAEQKCNKLQYCHSCTLMQMVTLVTGKSAFTTECDSATPCICDGSEKKCS